METQFTSVMLSLVAVAMPLLWLIVWDKYKTHQYEKKRRFAIGAAYRAAQNKGIK